MAEPVSSSLRSTQYDWWRSFLVSFIFFIFIAEILGLRQKAFIVAAIVLILYRTNIGTVRLTQLSFGLAVLGVSIWLGIVPPVEAWSEKLNILSHEVRPAVQSGFRS